MCVWFLVVDQSVRSNLCIRCILGELVNAKMIANRYAYILDVFLDDVN